MARLCILFAALLMISAISLVTARYQSRQLFIMSDRLADQARELETDWRRLQLERAELVRHARIDEVARKDLKMTTTSLNRNIYIKNEAAAASAQLPGAQP
ncbi:MAG: cell division protein FtsL [Candidimonas sp.]|jgi:cell division protein FtsL